jgi:hypothetical protein
MRPWAVANAPVVSRTLQFNRSFWTIRLEATLTRRCRPGRATSGLAVVGSMRPRYLVVDSAHDTSVPGIDTRAGVLPPENE